MRSNPFSISRVQTLACHTYAICLRLARRLRTNGRGCRRRWMSPYGPLGPLLHVAGFGRTAAVQTSAIAPLRVKLNAVWRVSNHQQRRARKPLPSCGHQGAGPQFPHCRHLHKAPGGARKPQIARPGQDFLVAAALQSPSRHLRARPAEHLSRRDRNR